MSAFIPPTPDDDYVRMGNLLFAHMECWEWLRAGEQS